MTFKPLRRVATLSSLLLACVPFLAACGEEGVHYIEGAVERVSFDPGGWNYDTYYYDVRKQDGVVETAKCTTVHVSECSQVREGDHVKLKMGEMVNYSTGVVVLSIMERAVPTHPAPVQ